MVAATSLLIFLCMQPGFACLLIKKEKCKQGMVAQAYDSDTGEAEARTLPQVQGHLGDSPSFCLHSKDMKEELNFIV